MPSEKPVRMKLRITQSKVDRARALLGTKSDTETIERALDLVIGGANATGAPPANPESAARPQRGPQP